MDDKNYYTILGIDKQASKTEIKKAFHKLAHKHHPDKKGGDEAKFKEINEAYSILSDEKKRSEYDTYGRVFNGGNPGGAPPQGQGFGGFAQGFGGGQEFDMGDIFGDIFGGRRQREKRGRDMSMDIEVSFVDSVYGTVRKVLLTKTSACSHCGGKGAEPDSKMKKCDTCNGQGKIHETKQSFLGNFSMERICSACHGVGEIPEKVCKDCHGIGITKGQVEVSIKVPEGINSGEMIRLAGGGEAVQGGTAGDLYVKVYVQPHSDFKRQGNDLVTNLNIKLTDALLGADYTIKSLDDNDLNIKVPSGVTFGETLRLRGKGIDIPGSRKGEMLINIQIKLPLKLSRKNKKLVEELKKEGL